MKLASVLFLFLFCYSNIAKGQVSYQPDEILVYKTTPQTSLKLHVFKPENYKKEDKRPVVVFFFGGGWSGGSPKQFYQQASFFSERGIVAISAEYRVFKKHKTTPFDCVRDAKSAIRWVRAHADELGIDPDRVIASGGSAGGHLAACTGVIEGNEEAEEDLKISSVPNAMLLFNPVIDTTEKGYGLEKVGEARKTEISPCSHVRKGIVPTLIFHGTDDKRVPFENVQRFTNLMNGVGNNCELIAYKGKIHGFFNGSFFRKKSKDVVFNSTMEKSMEFLQELGFIDEFIFETKIFYPKFSWETTPMYYMFCEPKRVLYPEEVAYIAERTDFICIEKSHAKVELGAAELGAKIEIAAFKKIKPEIKALFYFNAAYAWPFTSYNKIFTTENINNYPALKQILIENPDTKELQQRDNVFFFNVLNPDFRKWWVNTVAKGVKFSGADGAFIDQMHGFAWLRPDKAEDVEKAMGEMIKALKEKLGPTKIVLGNNANAKFARHVFPSVDANMFEHSGNTKLSKEKLLNDWEEMHRISKAGKMSIFRIGVEYDHVAVADSTYYNGQMRNERLAKLSKEKLEYYHACYLIGAQPYSYFQYGWGWQLAHGSLMDYPAFQKSLGTPKGAYNRTSSTDWEFTREFEHASVWVNTETRQARITWH